MSENLSIDQQYEALPRFNTENFPKGSFLDWTKSNGSKRRAYFADVESIQAMLVKLAISFPQLRVIRGASLHAPLGTFEGNPYGQRTGVQSHFSIGNIVKVRDYLLYDYTQEPRLYPVLVSAHLVDIVHLIQEGQIELFFDRTSNLARFSQEGSIAIGAASLAEDDRKKVFSITKPPDTAINPSLFASFDDTFQDGVGSRILRFFKRG